MARFFACPSCSCHVREGERVCPHCDARIHVDARGRVGRTTGSVLFGLAVAALPSSCGTSAPSVGGAGGTGGTGSSSHVTTTWMNVASTYGTAPSVGSSMVDCGALPCSDEDSDTSNDCLSCSQTRGLCVFETQACVDNAECGAFIDCLEMCPEDDPVTMEDENFDCICVNDGTKCASTQPAGTCVGDHMGGVTNYIALSDCVYGDGNGNDGECTLACAAP